MRKDVGIATIVALNNYGAILQSVALLAEVQKLGYSCEIIDFREKNQNDLNMFVKVKSITDLLRNLRKLPHYKQHKNRLKLFSDFANENISFSPSFFYNELGDVSKRYSVLCTGSDQTFNVLLPAFKKEYYLPFSNNIPKMSYAASFGENIAGISEEQQKWILEQLSKYRFLSIREKSGVEFAEKITGRKDVVQVLDPTLLLTSKDWRKFLPNVSSKSRKPYILFYSVLSDAWVVERVEAISKALDLPVYAPHLQNMFEIGKKFHRIIECGPIEFMQLIDDAELVLTTSFHATVFSLQFQRPFYSFALGEGNRIGSLLSSFGLDVRLLTRDSDIISSIIPIDYRSVDEKMNRLREISIDYLSNSLFALVHRGL